MAGRVKEKTQFMVGCETSKEWDKLMKAIEKIFPRIRWNGGDKPMTDSAWHCYGKDTIIGCLEVDDYKLTYGTPDVYDPDINGIEIISVNGFIRKYSKKIVFTQGSFDLFHYGHVRFIERAKALGSYLIVGVNTDKLYKDYKSKTPVIPYKYRAKTIRAMKGVDEVIPTNRFSPMRLLKKYKPDVYVICREWAKTKDKEIEYMKSIGGKTVVLPYLKTISASEIRSKLVKNYLDHNKLYCAECHKRL